MFVVAGRLVDLAPDHFHPALDLDVLALALDDGGVVLVDGDLLRLPQVAPLYVLTEDLGIKLMP